MGQPTFDGLLVLDKRSGITSRAAVDHAQRWFPRGTRIGHTGTLDPLATGVLVLCLGTATKLAEYVQRMRKTYTSTFRLGASSDTDDADGAVRVNDGILTPTRETVEAALAGFLGDIAQTPPAYSAAHVAGQRAYALARQGAAVHLEARTVTVHGIEVTRYEFPALDVTVHCGKGTYIRSLARDLGERLGTGGMVQTLRRTRIGPFAVADALSLDAGPEEARERLRPLVEALAEFPSVVLGDAEASRFRDGQRLRKGGPEGEVAVVDAAGHLVAVGAIVQGWLRPVRVWRE
jgi:tRNA pseudouridine55 synthase